MYSCPMSTMDLKQKTCNFHFVFVTVVILALWPGVLSSICDNGVCSCSPTGRIFNTIDCKCNATKQDLIFTSGDFGSSFKNIREFFVSDCDGTVNFKRNAFKDLKNLEKLHLNNVRKAEFEPGVFEKLTELDLQDITEINFVKRAFMGANDLQHIVIRRAIVPTLLSHALFDITGLRKLELSDVVLHHAEKEAVKIDLSHSESEVLISNCTIGKIESDGIVLKAKNFSIIGSDLQELLPNAINITSDLVLISESNFGDNAINMAATIVNINRNTFKLLPQGILESTKNLANGKFIFKNNTVSNIEIKKYPDIVSASMGTLEISGNYFPCTCFVGEILKVLPKLGNNFCITRCNLSLSDFVVLIKEQKVCELDDSVYPEEEEFCRDVTYTTPHSRQGRTDPYFGSTMAPSATTKKPGNSSGRIEIVPVLLFFTLLTAMF